MLNKFKDAKIYLINTSESSVLWPESSSSKKEVRFKNTGDVCRVGMVWYPVKDDIISYIRVIGRWHHARVDMAETFSDGVYDLKKTSKSMSKSNASGINKEESENDPINVVKESDEIVIKGAVRGTNIHVYNTKGVEVKSVISNNDVVKIKLPTKRIYSVHVGKSEYKVAM